MRNICIQINRHHWSSSSHPARRMTILLGHHCNGGRRQGRFNITFPDPQHTQTHTRRHLRHMHDNCSLLGVRVVPRLWLEHPKEITLHFFFINLHSLSACLHFNRWLFVSHSHGPFVCAPWTATVFHNAFAFLLLLFRLRAFFYDYHLLLSLLIKHYNQAQLIKIDFPPSTVRAQFPVWHTHGTRWSRTTKKERERGVKNE